MEMVPMTFTPDQLRKAILRERRLAAEYRATLRLALAAFYEKQAAQREADLLKLEGAAS
jgi:hypothetical protein